MATAKKKSDKVYDLGEPAVKTVNPVEPKKDSNEITGVSPEYSKSVYATGDFKAKSGGNTETAQKSTGTPSAPTAPKGDGNSDDK